MSTTSSPAAAAAWVRAVRGLAGACEWLLACCAGALLALAMLACAMEAFDRYFVQLPWGSFDQYARLALVGIVFYALPVASRRNENIRLHLLEQRLGRRGRRRLHTLFDLLIVGICGVFLSTAQEVIRVGSNQGVLGTPFDYGIVYIAMSISFAAVALFRVEALLLRFSGHAAEI